MKPVIILSIIVCVSACTTDKPTHSYDTVIISTISDMTDKHTVLPTKKTILPLFGLTQHPEQAATFRMSTITDKRLNPVYTCGLSNQAVTQDNNTTGDPLHRTKCITAFYEQTELLLKKIQTSDSVNEMLNSECAYSIGKELQYMTTDTSTKKILVVYSNLREKSSLFDSYKRLPSSKEIEKLLEESGFFPASLVNITIYFVFSPKDRDEDKVYMQLVTAYQHFLERRGARVMIQANDDTFL